MAGRGQEPPLEIPELLIDVFSMFKSLLLISCCVLRLTVSAQTAAEYVTMANKAYDAGQNDKAKLLYQKAAAMNSAEGHFALAYKYVLPQSEQIYHYSEAAKMGHSEATGYVLEALFFRSSSLTVTNPVLAYEIYKQAKAKNSSMKVFWEEEQVEVLKQCIEAGSFDVAEFIKKYRITAKDTSDNVYSIWELAAEASHNGRFGPANPKLVLQLVCKGGEVPAEKMSAVTEAYANWKSNKIVRFDPCDYAGSGIGMAYCSGKAAEDAEKEYNTVIKKLAARLKNNAGPLLRNAYDMASRFFDNKAFLEEGHGGTGRTTWARESIDQQKAGYLDLVKKIDSGFVPKLDKAKNYDKELNEMYRTVIADLKKKPISTADVEISDHDIVMVQRAWIKYRDASAKLFTKMAPSLTELQWKDYLTKIRTHELKQIKELRE